MGAGYANKRIAADPEEADDRDIFETAKRRSWVKVLASDRSAGLDRQTIGSGPSSTTVAFGGFRPKISEETAIGWFTGTHIKSTLNLANAEITPEVGVKGERIDGSVLLSELRWRRSLSLHRGRRQLCGEDAQQKGVVWPRQHSSRPRAPRKLKRWQAIYFAARPIFLAGRDADQAAFDFPSFGRI
jgi:hypothetical protein